MEKVIDKIIETIALVVKPSHLIIVLAIISWGLLFAPNDLSQNLGIQAEIQHFRFWIILFALMTSGITILSVFVSLYMWIRRVWRKQKDNASIKSLALSDGSVYILTYLNGHLPDSCRLWSKHVDVRALRKHELVSQKGANFYSDYEYFVINDKGREALNRLYSDRIGERTDGDKLEYLRSVTGEQLFLENYREF